MPKLFRWIAVVLAVCILINIIPVSVVAQEGAVSEPSEPGTLLEESEPEESEPEESQPEGSEPEESEPEESQAEGSEPEESEPEESQPEGSEPEESQPEESEPEESQPEESEPEENQSEEIQSEELLMLVEALEDEPAVLAVEYQDLFAKQFAVVLNTWISENNIEDISISDILEENGTDITLHVPKGRGVILEMLSQQEQTADCNYMKWTIHFNSTGDVEFLANSSFMGLGDQGFPFSGALTGEKIRIRTTKTLFKELSASAVLNGISIVWSGSSTSPILTQKLIVSDNQQHTIDMPLIQTGTFSPYIEQLMVDSVYSGEVGEVVLPELNYPINDEVSVDSYGGDVGLVCCTMGENTKLTVDTLRLGSKAVTLRTAGGNAGALVGSMATGAQLTIGTLGSTGSTDPEATPAEPAATESLTLNADVAGMNAGGLVGSMTDASIVLNMDVALSSESTVATNSAGGVAGVVTTVGNPLTGSGKLTLSAAVVNGESNSGGMYGTCTVSGDFQMDSPAVTASLKGNKTNCGGVFGTLTLSDNGKVTLVNPKVDVTLTEASNSTSFGGVVGKLEGSSQNDGGRNALVVDGGTVKSNVTVAQASDNTNNPKYLGGIAAQQATAALDVKNVTVSVTNPLTPSSGGFGGLTALVENDCLVRGSDITVETSGSANIGGGIAYSTGKGSVIALEGAIDLSKCALTAGTACGNLVAKQDCSLISGYGATITRNGLALDDIGNYGELYRVENFLTIKNDYSFDFQKTLDLNEGLSNQIDYACLALAWQSRGYFSTVSGVSEDNISSLTDAKCAITLKNDIDLSGCGIGGLTRDYKADIVNDTFSGTLNGNACKIKLDIGGENRIYRHNSLGLFAQLSNGATVENLTIAGDIQLNNSVADLNCGGLAARLNCNSTREGARLSSVSTLINIDAQCNGKIETYIGGLFGGVNGAVKTTLNLTSSLGASITASSISENGAYLHMGGAIGGINASNVTIVCNGAVLTGGIDCSAGSVYNLYAGGLVGTIFPDTSSVRKIQLNNLTVGQDDKAFSISGNAITRMGGLLGGIWADTDVEISGLKVNRAALTASGAAELGGLVYGASGKWTVSSVDMSGLTIDASKATALGLMVCKGGQDQVPINTKNYDLTGLYLAMTEHWDWDAENNTGYRVPTKVTIGNSVYDEFVAYTARANWSGSSVSYDITDNGAGIISLTTKPRTVTMDGENRNTYDNRVTSVMKTTNPNSRYYYNLPQGISVDNSNINSPEKLLLWSINRYAAEGLKTKYFPVTGDTIPTITGDDEGNLNMAGLSYYPVTLTNSNVIVENAKIIFCNEEIEKQEAGNKLTRLDGSSRSQHYTMHCGLFLNFTAENNTTPATYKMTVNGVSFGGTVGVVDGKSGALICGTVRGENKTGSAPAVCSVILADEDVDTMAVTLDGVRALGDGYKPVLIGSMESYTELRANYLTATGYGSSTGKAGSSLIGAVGDANATNIIIAFGGTIILPDKTNDSIFESATMFKSLQYQTGSATYQFNREKEYSGNTYTHNATYGLELGEGKSVEYSGKLGCYNDAFGGEWYIDKDNTFSGYLPYVFESPASKDNTHTMSNKYHELAVNVHSTDLTVGCGTYGDPYLVDATLLAEVAKYIGGGAAGNKWSIQMPKKDAQYHATTNANPNSDQHNTVQHLGGSWPEGYTDDTIRKYLAGAYYKLVSKDDSESSETVITLSGFDGLGTQDLPFTGVIEGNGMTVKMTGSSKSFINYSYGSVVRNVTFNLQQNMKLSSSTLSQGSAQMTPTTFFGGVIGCVLGGDNIIENVSLDTTEFGVTTSGTYGYLIPVGGYIGVIAGGGVIFRGTYSGGISVPAEASLYRNPIIGRVLNGFAYYEGSGDAPNNGDRNYKINTVSKEDGKYDLSWDGTTLEIKNGQGLLLLSGIVSSGAGSTASDAYAKGKARLANYQYIGNSSKPDDYDTACKDDGAVWENEQTPYLLSKYAGYKGNDSICGSAITVELASGGTFDMTGYDNGYRGLSARYASNAAFPATGLTADGITTVDASRVVMRVKTFNGNSNTVSGINMDVKEYATDDFHAASIGGIFNIVWTASESVEEKKDSIFAQNLTLRNCNVQLSYFKKDDTTDNGKLNQADKTTFLRKYGFSCVAVGGFIGSVSDLIGTDDTDASKRERNYLLKNLRIQGDGSTDADRAKITGPNSAGGLIGSSAMTNQTLIGYPGRLLSNRENAMFGANFLNCSYENVNITAKLSAGGLIGEVYAQSKTTEPDFTGLGISVNNFNNGCYTSCTVTDANCIVGKNAKVIAEMNGGVSGGILGASGIRIRINADKIDTLTALTIIDNNPIQPVSLEDVVIQAGTVNKENYSSSGKNGLQESGRSQSVAGGCVGRIGSVNPAQFFDIKLNRCTVSTGTHATGTDNNNVEQYAGGVVSMAYNNTSVRVERCYVENSGISSQYAGGFVGYGYSASGFNLHMRDCRIEDSTVEGCSYAGGLVGRAASTYYLFNILIKNTGVTAINGTSGKPGRLFGEMSSSIDKQFYVYASGISVYADQVNKVPDSVGGNTASYRNGYVIYADYRAQNTSTPTGSYDPYVTNNPRYLLNGADKTLIGDAVGQFNSKAISKWIWDDKNSKTPSDRQNKAVYTNVSEEAPNVSMFQTIQGSGPDQPLPVLVLKDSNTDTITNYLNIITNGGYGQIVANSPSSVRYIVSAYVWDEQQEAFIEQNASVKTSVYLDNGTLRVNGQEYDNGKNRFSLLEVKFSTSDTVMGNFSYTISIPIVVIRQLQYLYMATFSYGKEFHAPTYDTLRSHVLESTDTPFTAYITYQYNWEYDGKRTYAEYDWQGYMESRGNMLGVDKELNFTNWGGLPAGTQLTLVDCQNGNKAYCYTTKTAGETVKLSQFHELHNEDVTFQSSMADILNVTRSEQKDDGRFVKLSGPAGATVRLDGAYYRLWEAGLSGERYDLTVPELDPAKNTAAEIPEENYFLVITVPSQSQNPNFYMNGSLDSKLVWEMPNSGEKLLRHKKKDGTDAPNLNEGVNGNNESNYQISDGYRQTLKSTADSDTINLGGLNNPMQVKIQNEITFSNPTYDDGDKLYLKFSLGLKDDAVKSTLFPQGITGTVVFHVKDSGGNFYFYDTEANQWKGPVAETPAASYPWEFNTTSGSMNDLPLSANGTDPLDLSVVRKRIEDQVKQGTLTEKKIIITAAMDISMDDTLLKAVVPASDQSGVDHYTQLTYQARLSTRVESLDYSTVRQNTTDNAKYYRSVQYKAVLSMDAVNISQLGVNPLAPIPEYLTDDGKSQIDIVAALDMENLPDMENVLRGTKSIVFTLSLNRRDDAKEDGYTHVQEAGYIDFPGWEENRTDDLLTWTRSIPQPEFYDGGIITGGCFDGKKFVIPLTAKVSMDMTSYANYKISMNVVFIDAGGQALEVDVNRDDAYVVYTYACIRPIFYAGTQ